MSNCRVWARWPENRCPPCGPSLGRESAGALSRRQTLDVRAQASGAGLGIVSTEQGLVPALFFWLLTVSLQTADAAAAPSPGTRPARCHRRDPGNQGNRGGQAKGTQTRAGDAVSDFFLLLMARIACEVASIKPKRVGDRLRESSAPRRERWETLPMSQTKSPIVRLPPDRAADPTRSCAGDERRENGGSNPLRAATANGQPDRMPFDDVCVRAIARPAMTPKPLRGHAAAVGPCKPSRPVPSRKTSAGRTAFPAQKLSPRRNRSQNSIHEGPFFGHFDGLPHGAFGAVRA